MHNSVITNCGEVYVYKLKKKRGVNLSEYYFRILERTLTTTKLRNYIADYNLNITFILDIFGLSTDRLNFLKFYSLFIFLSYFFFTTKNILVIP